MDDVPVVTVFLRNRGEVLLLRRSDDVGSYPGQWGGVAGHVKSDDPLGSALDEIEEKTGLTEEAVSLRREGTPFTVDDDERGTRWHVHPFLFDASTRSITTNWETEEAEWVAPPVIRRRDTVPELWTSYRRVAPSILTLTDDTTHGSADLSIRALEILRDRAGMLATADSPDIEDARARLVETVQRLLDARPSMAALGNRLHRVMSASRPELVPATVEVNAHEATDRALSTDEEAAHRTADRIAGQDLLTLSRSGTVIEAIRHAEPSPSVVVAESRPGREGVDVAEALAENGIDVTLLPDAAAPTALTTLSLDAVLVGADTVLPSGAVVNKVGTYGIALAAYRSDVPFFAACSTDKISIQSDASLEEVPPRAVYEGPADVNVYAPRFDVTPSDLVTGGIITERETLTPDTIDHVVEELERLRAWM